MEKYTYCKWGKLLRANISPFPSLYFYVRRMGRWMVPLVKDNNPHGTVSLGFDEEYAREDRQENFKISHLITCN